MMKHASLLLFFLMCLLNTSTALATPANDACVGKSINDTCTLNNEQGTCQGDSNNCDVEPVNGQCISCKVPTTPPPNNTPTIQDKLTPDHPSSSFCTLGDGSIGQWHANYNNCGQPDAPCKYCAVPECNSQTLGNACTDLRLDNAVCERKTLRCPVGASKPCFICANDNEEFQAPEEENNSICTSTGSHGPADGALWFGLLGLGLWGVRRRRR